jgi:ketosteroid isomerase-like protein
VLDKGQWLERYRSGDFATKSLAWDDVTVRDYGNTAITVGTQTQQASYQGNPANGQFRVTHVWVRDGAGWELAGVHLSPIGGPPPFAPPDR